MNKKTLNQLFEWYGVDPARVPDYEEFWALYATSFYERLFGLIEDEKQLERVYQKYVNSPKLDKRARLALTFFYNIRRDEMADPHYWDKVGGHVQENKKYPMKAKFVNESLTEYNNAFGPMAGSGNRDRSVRSLVQEVGELDLKILTSGNTKAQNEWDRISGEYLYSNEGDMMLDPDDEEWNDEPQGERYWDDLQDFELERAIQDAEIIIGEYKLNESLNESVSRHCDIYKTQDGKWYMDLANEEYGEYDDCTTYGPFSSEEAADTYLHDNHSNPGGGWVDDSGDRPVPTESPNGSKIVSPRGGGRNFGYGGRFTGVSF